MSDTEVTTQQMAVDARKSIEDFIDQISQDNFAKAERTFSDMVGGRLGNALDQTKAKIAGQVFQEVEPEMADEEEIPDDEPEEVDLTPTDMDDEEGEEEFEIEDDEEEI